jgi:hypothetical protein
MGVHQGHKPGYDLDLPIPLRIIAALVWHAEGLPEKILSGSPRRIAVVLHKDSRKAPVFQGKTRPAVALDVA